jgi:excisionase family DNA binding protein
VGEDRTDAHSVGRGSDRLTIADAAALLRVHKNTIRNRIKNGTYKAEKVITERGPTYLIERESLLTNVTTSALSSTSQQLVSTQGMEFVQELLRPFVRELGQVREELGAERARRLTAEERTASLEAELETLREPQELSSDQREFLRHLRAELASGRLYPATGDREETESEYWEAMQRKRFLLLIFLFLTVVGAGLSVPLVAASSFSCPSSGIPWSVLVLGLLLLPPLYGYWLGRQYILPLLSTQDARHGFLADHEPSYAARVALSARVLIGGLWTPYRIGSRYLYLAVQALEVALGTTVLSLLTKPTLESAARHYICGYSGVLQTTFGVVLLGISMFVGTFLFVVFSGLIGFARARQRLLKQLEADHATEFGTEAVREAVSSAGLGGRNPDALLGLIGLIGTILTTLSALFGLLKVFTDTGA